MIPIRLGSLQIDRVEELEMVRVPPKDLLVGVSQEELEKNLAALPVGSYDAATGHVLMTVQSWIVRTPHHIVLIDACAGNHKHRPKMPLLDQLDTPWLERLAAKGISPNDVDFVMCTHLHADHVGWNTRLENGRWVPTFPNARYLFSRQEYESYTQMDMNAEDYGAYGVFQDSVLPCVEAGLTTCVEDGYSIEELLRFEAAPGHTVGNMVISAGSQGKTALFVGDCMHTPVQIVYPDANHVIDADPIQARATRRRLLSEAAEHGHLLIPAHFPAPYVGRVTRRSSSEFDFHPGV